MFWRTFIFATLAVGALAVKIELTEQNRESISTKLTTFCNKDGGGDDAKDNALKLTNSLQSFFDCVYPIMDTDTLKTEIKEAKPKGAVGEVFKKYCAKTPELKTCLHTLIDATSPCVEENTPQLAKNSTDSFIDYVCYNDGNRITQFLTENGPECIQSKTEDINRCAETLDVQLNFSLHNFLSMTPADKCRKVDVLSTCVLKSLEPCTTPGNSFSSLFAYIRKGSVCNDALPLPQ